LFNLQVCRVLQGFYQAALSDAAHPSASAQSNGQVEKRNPRQLLEARMHVEEVLGASLLPSLQLLPANPAVGLAIWDVMCLLPYEVTFGGSLLHCVLYVCLTFFMY